MRANLWALAAVVVLAGCPSSPPGPSAATSSATAASEPVPSGMPIAPLEVLPQRAEGRFRVERSALDQAIALATAGQLPLASTTDGYRVLRADEGSLLERAGFRVDDELLRIANVPVSAPDLLVQLHPVWEHRQFQVVFRRGGQERRHTYEMRRPSPPSAVLRGDAEREPFDQEAFARGVDVAADGTFVVKRKAFDMLLEDQSATMRSARIVPSKEGDRVVGLKFFGIRRGSPLEVLGFRNGDVVNTVDGHDVSTPERALEAYGRVKNATKLDVVITRRGEPLTLRYRLVE